MSEDTSLTDAVKLAAGISLTEAVQNAAGRRAWFVDAALEALDEAGRGGGRDRVQRLLAGCAQLAAIAILSVAILLGGATDTGSDRAPRAAPQKRVALVIGNSAYRYTPKLANPRNDAADIGAALRKLGFQVIEAFDLDKAAFERAIRDFAAALQGAQVGMFFYAGHGLQVSGLNYLVPIDAQLSAISALDVETVRLDFVQRQMEGQAKTNILFFDACRDNPLSRNLARAMGTRSLEIGRGFAAIQSGVGTLISFSTQPEKVAFDGKGRNSPFSGALVRQLGASTDDLTAILIAVRNDVMKETDGKQVPWEHSALTGRVYFNRAAQASTPDPAQRRPSEAAEAWSAVKDTSSISVLGVFADRYGDTFFAELARARIEELKAQGSAPPPPAAQVVDATPSSSE